MTVEKQDKKEPFMQVAFGYQIEKPDKEAAGRKVLFWRSMYLKNVVGYKYKIKDRWGSHRSFEGSINN